MCVELIKSVKNMYLLLFVVWLTGSVVEALECNSAGSDFSRSSIVKPIILHGRTKREISTTKDTNGEHHSAVTIKLLIDGEEYFLDLRLNHELVTADHVLSYQERGENVVHKPKKEELDLCHYSGSVRGKPSSWATVSTCHGIQGMVSDGERVIYIEPVQGGNLNSAHYIFEHNDLVETHPGKDYYTISNSSQATLHTTLKNRHKRHASSDQLIHGPYAANERSLYVELTLVVDRRHYDYHKQNLRSIHNEMKTIANHMNAIYSKLNIYIALVGVVVWNQYDEINLNTDSQGILDGFIKYRRTELIENNILNDFAFLITHQKFENSVIGKAYIRRICSMKASAGVGNYHTHITGLLAMTIAHELGHSLGMDHYDLMKDCECPHKKCIMSSMSTGIIPTAWSTCSLNALAFSFSKGLDYCLRNKPKRLFDSPTCGNGFVEPGEQCDCGLSPVAGAYNACHACCDAHTCMLRSNATCAAGMCCELKTCRFKPLGTVCRAAYLECDLPEYCSGDSAYCPDDVHKMDTTPCGTGDESAYCVNGGCQTHSGQCRALWGSTGKSCYNELYNDNMRPGFGDCGYDRITKSYGPCLKQNVMCGRLFCSHLSSHRSGKLQIGSDESPRTITSRTLNKIVTCQVVTIDLGLSVPDFGMVPDGAKCGDGMMCLNQKCVSVAAIRERIKHLDSSVCPSNCSGHGVCNSLGHCHCERGFAPPLCSEPGAGGSSDSEPASDTSILKRLMIALYILFLGIVPATAMILLAVYCSRNNGFQWKQFCKLNFKSKDGNTTTENVRERESKIYANSEIFCTENSKNGGANAYNSSTIYGNVKEISNPRIQRLVKHEPPVKATKPTIVVQREVVFDRTEKIKPQPLPKPSSGISPNENRPTVSQIRDMYSTTNKSKGGNSNNLGNSLAEALKKRNEERLNARSRKVVL